MRGDNVMLIFAQLYNVMAVCIPWELVSALAKISNQQYYTYYVYINIIMIIIIIDINMHISESDWIESTNSTITAATK